MGLIKDISYDLMGTKSNTRHIKLTCPDANFELTINSDAFRSSRSTALGVSIENCDLSQLDWRFLNEFSVLESMHLVGSTLKNNNMNSFPLLTSVSSFSMLNCGNFDVLYPPERTPHLIHLQIDNSFNVSDDAFERIISASADGPYRDSLQILSLVRNKMTRIPSAIGNFTNLRHLLLSGNSIQILSRGSLHFPSNSLSTLWLNHNLISTIQPEAFKGWYLVSRLMI
jgi:Leucine-rich repeat (LRR) protein